MSSRAPLAKILRINENCITDLFLLNLLCFGRKRTQQSGCFTDFSEGYFSLKFKSFHFDSDSKIEERVVSPVNSGDCICRIHNLFGIRLMRKLAAGLDWFGECENQVQAFSYLKFWLAFNTPLILNFSVVVFTPRQTILRPQCSQREKPEAQTNS
uniref:Uncharacterized protein n=1 Tax=Leersia perrieri TaxID=77586 RepID=A0A0D9WPZ4_9ORYZ